MTSCISGGIKYDFDDISLFAGYFSIGRMECSIIMIRNHRYQAKEGSPLKLHHADSTSTHSSDSPRCF